MANSLMKDTENTFLHNYINYLQIGLLGMKTISLSL
jgi:hypothetical protein